MKIYQKDGRTFIEGEGEIIVSNGTHANITVKDCKDVVLTGLIAKNVRGLKFKEKIEFVIKIWKMMK